MAHFYRRQPPRGAKVAGGSPLGRGITAHFPFNGTLASAARNRGRSPVVTAGPALRASSAGWLVQGNGSGKVVYPDLLPAAMGAAGAAPRTIVAEFYMGDTSASKCVLSFGDTSAGMRSQFTLLTNNQYRSVQLATYGNDINYSPFSTGGTGARVFLSIAYDGNTTLTFRSWSRLDSTGEVVFNSQTATLGGPLNTGNTVPLNLMGGGTYGFAAMVTALYHLSIYGGRCLTPAEMDRLYADRHQVMAAPASFPYAAIAAPVPILRTLSVDVASFVLGGPSASLRIGRRLPAEQGNFGAAVAASRAFVARRLSAATGFCGFSAGAVSLRGARRLVAGVGAISVAGNPGDMTYAPVDESIAQRYTLAGAAGEFDLAGPSAVLRIERRLSAAQSALGTSSAPARLLPGYRLSGAGGVIVLQERSAAMRTARRAQADAAAYDLGGGAGQLRYSAQIDYARAPAGPGYTPQQHYNESRPAATSARRPAALQRNNR